MKDFVYNPPESAIEILFEDDMLLGVNKPAGLLSVPGRAEKHKDSLFTRLNKIYPELRIIHRLDMDTSGVMIFAITSESLRNLSRQFELKQTSKEYVCRVDGVVDPDAGEIDLPLRCDWPNRPLQMVDPVQGKSALTRWKVLERKQDETRLALYPLTGRSHQLRVHCQSMGHPILGDRFYGSHDVIARSSRLCLHSQTLTFTHPVTNEKMTINKEADF